MELYFSDNFFSRGETRIMDTQGKDVGTLDLQSMFKASLLIYGPDQRLRYSAKFRSFSNRWQVLDVHSHVTGVLRAKFSWLKKSYHYDAGSRGHYKIDSPAFSKSYSITDSNGHEVAIFERTSRGFQPGAFRLDNHSGRLDPYELIAVIMGIHSIDKNTAAIASS